jgi:hypothetical protein
MASDTIDRDDARTWLGRWKEVNAVTLAEDLALTPEEKLYELDSLMESADLFDWPASGQSESEDEQVRAIWMRLHALERC